jgi:hypothetical protein
MQPLNIPFRTFVGLAILLLNLPLNALAQHGHELAADTCVLHLGPYKLYFNSYQPDIYYDKQFCQEIPGTGNTVLVFDFVEQELRSLPVEVRIIRDTGSDQNIEAATVVHLPPKIYPTGSIDVKYNFDTPGKFIGMVSIGEKQEHLSRFGFSIGQTGAVSHFTHYMVIFVPLAVAIAIATFYMIRDRRKTTEPLPSPEA